MNKALVELYVPAIGDHFDMFVPVDAPIGELTEVIADGIVELTNGKYVASKYEQLCLRVPAGLLNPELTLQDYGVRDGTRLYLV